jgi:hypothetical protein
VPNLDLIPTNPFHAPPSEEPDQYTKYGLNDAKVHAAFLRNKALSQDIQARRTYAGCAFWLVVCWLGLVFVILFFQGFFGNGGQVLTLEYHGVKFSYSKPPVFSLPEGVLVTLIGGTSGSVFGIFAAVMNYLFPNRKK